MATLETMGFAILGTGVAADYHRQAIAANAEVGARLVAVGHHDPSQFEPIGTRFGVPCVSEMELLSNPLIDVVCICTPSGQHAAQAVLAAAKGKHVLVEKPMALNLDDADTMIAACAQSGVQLGVVLQRRAEPLFRRIYDALHVGELGDLALGVVTVPYHRPQAYYDHAAWRGTWSLDGGGVLMNQGIHLVDLLLWYMGNPVAVQAFAATLCRRIEVEDTLTAILRFASGAMATITATTTASPGFPHRIEIYGTHGGIQIEGEALRRWTSTKPSMSTVAEADSSASADAGSGADPRGVAPTGHIAIVRDFIHALREGHAPEVDGVEGRRSLAAVVAVYEAAGLL